MHGRPHLEAVGPYSGERHPSPDGAPPRVGPDRAADDHRSAVAAERFVGLYQREFAVLTRAANVLVGDWALAEDIVQTVFADVFRRWEALGEVDGMGAYLHRAVINRCRTHYRVVARDARRLSFPEPRLVRDPADHAIATVDSTELRAAVARLSARQRECVVAHFLLEQTEAETAEMLGISVGSVRTHTRRGLQALQKAMKR